MNNSPLNPNPYLLEIIHFIYWIMLLYLLCSFQVNYSYTHWCSVLFPLWLCTELSPRLRFRWGNTITSPNSTQVWLCHYIIVFQILRYENLMFYSKIHLLYELKWIISVAPSLLIEKRNSRFFSIFFLFEILLLFEVSYSLN